MSIIDKLLSFDTAATVTGGTTVKSVDVIDLSTTTRKIGTGEPLYAVFKVISKSGGDGSDTFVFAVQTDDNSSMSSAVDIAVSRTITGIANITTGMTIVVPIPPGISAERYLAARYAVTADAVLVVTAYLTDDPPPEWTAYADAT